ncbi:MAG: helix-turn-helix domain-containing protein [Alphaproteobacteria bacterium]
MNEDREAEAIHAAQQRGDFGGAWRGPGVWRDVVRSKGTLSLVDRVGTVILTIVRIVLTVLRIRARVDPRSIDPDRIYSTRELARLLEIGRSDVIRLIHAGKLKARKSGRNYHILGRSIIRYLRG